MRNLKEWELMNERLRNNIDMITGLLVRHPDVCCNFEENEFLLCEYLLTYKVDRQGSQGRQGRPVDLFVCIWNKASNQEKIVNK